MSDRNSCDVCGETKQTETLQWGDRGEPFLIARACGDCRRGVVMPALRRVFGGSGINLNDPGDPWTERDPEGSAAFFRTEAGTVHAVRSVTENPTGDSVCYGYCGIRRLAEPQEAEPPLDPAGDGCGRCALSAPHLFEEDEA